MYDHVCPDCGGHVETLSISEDAYKKLQKSFNKLVRWLFDEKKTSVALSDLDEKTVTPFFDGIHDILHDGFSSGIAQSMPAVLRRDLAENVYVFSGAKTYAELKELSGMLLDDKGNIKPFNKYWQEVQEIYPRYNQNYLEAEYIFATQSAQMASKWSEFEADGNRYNLQYRTAADERVRETHRALHDITLPPSDPFWDKYYPPNGWRCRCTVVQVRKSKYPESNSDESRLAGAEATAGKDTIFRFNPGKQKMIFPDHHPYMQQLTNDEMKTLRNKAKERS